MTIIASLPSALLWAASFAASNDPSKGPICSIEARRHGNGIRIAAVDSHRAFVCCLPASEAFSVPEEPLRLSPKTFNKAPSRKGLKAELDDSGVVQFQGANGMVNGSAVWTADPWALSEQAFPDLDAIWPSKEQLSCNPGGFLCFSPSYVADFMKVAAKLCSGDAVRLFSRASHGDSVLWKAILDNDWLNGACNGEEIVMEYLLMPKWVRDRDC